PPANGIAREAAGRPPLTWRAEARPSRDYTVFVHLLDGGGRLVAQDDRPPVDGSYPTSIWENGERILDQHPVRPPPGRYRVVVGMYDPASRQRLRRAEGGRILGHASAARWDLQGLLLPVPDRLLDRDPGGGEWTLRATIGHVLEVQERYTAATAPAVERGRRGEPLPAPPPGGRPPPS